MKTLGTAAQGSGSASVSNPCALEDEASRPSAFGAPALWAASSLTDSHQFKCVADVSALWQCQPRVWDALPARHASAS